MALKTGSAGTLVAFATLAIAVAIGRYDSLQNFLIQALSNAHFAYTNNFHPPSISPTQIHTTRTAVGQGKSTQQAAEQRFIKWLQQNGASADNITLGYSTTGLRGVFAAEHINKGDTLIAVPHTLLLKLPYSTTGDFCEQGEVLMLGLLQRSEQHLPHIEVLPSLEDSMMSPDTYHLPVSYWQLLQSDVAEAFLLNQRMALKQYWQMHRQRLQRRGGSLELLRYALWLATSRTFGYNATHFSLVPLVDMTNHVNGCPTLHTDAPCPSDANITCFIIKAGAQIPQGSEVCNAYGWLRNDEAFFHYGFNLDEDHATELLFVVDQPNTSMEALAGVGYRAIEKPLYFTGTVAEVQHEVQRLEKRLQQLRFRNDAAQAWPVAEHDPGGVILGQVLKWRELRQIAIVRELERLKQQLDAQV